MAVVVADYLEPLDIGVDEFDLLKQLHDGIRLDHVVETSPGINMLYVDRSVDVEVSPIGIALDGALFPSLDLAVWLREIVYLPGAIDCSWLGRFYVTFSMTHRRSQRKKLSHE